ncbi:uncharacterized protein LOC111710011 [Eurytemora carolleeae]|uniref:uncharacterized protein LOC111710011 n=1 Tax=Eurytemora carolleeae TaxID=1294199 RepID=UPI000C76C491|nr:uncharacterized protein LOC111710011 [Eurytemora carolleeae]|eukprot:XP_023339776.1 uncharacterized protein LOC111710011 [Eurytemora affinis]
MLSSAHILITGCSRGLGLEMVKQLAIRETPPALILATCRYPETAGRLQELAEQYNNIKMIKFDVDKLDNLTEFSRTVSCLTDRLDILINNAGISPKATRINLVSPEQMERTLHTNLIAPLFITKALINILAKPVEGPGSLVVNISSILGSIAENTKQGGLYPYRCSKAGLNALTRSLSIDLKHQNISAVSIHPGWVKTDMGGNNAPLTAAQSIQGVLSFLDEFKPEEHNGNFYDNIGNPLPW